MARHCVQPWCTRTVLDRLHSPKGQSMTVAAPTYWAGCFWGRTLCSQDSAGAFSCVTGDCGSGKIECSGNGALPPATLAKFKLDGAGGLDFYDVSLVYGYNLPLLVMPQGGTAPAVQALAAWRRPTLTTRAPRSYRTRAWPA
ncbi:hypothetical protein SLA2020_271150 [Shorea laevis]